MAIRVEFYGLARQRAGVSEISLSPPAERIALAEVLSLASAAAPGFGNSNLVEQGQLHPTLRANLDGQQFISDPDTMIRDGQSVLILSADAGG
jgi:molybdopterin converting factor small subunit